jgi:hypothetical protein
MFKVLPLFKLGLICGNTSWFSCSQNISHYHNYTHFDFKCHVKTCCNIVGFEVLTAAVMKSSIFWNIMLCSLLKVSRSFGDMCCLYLQSQRSSQARNQLFSCSAYSSTLKTEVTCSSKMSADFQQTTWRYIPEDTTLHCHNIVPFLWVYIGEMHFAISVCDCNGKNLIKTCATSVTSWV